MKKFIKLIPVFLLFCLTSITVKAQDSTSLCLEELNTDVYEDILTEYYEVETGYAYCSSAVNLTSSVEITEDVSVTIPDAYGSNVWRVDTSLDTADSNCTVVELNNNFYYLSAVSNAVFTEEGVTFSTNKLGIYIAGGCFSEEDIENFSAGTSKFNIENNAIWTDDSGKAYYDTDALVSWDISLNEDGSVIAYLFDTDADTVGDTVVLDGVGETVNFNAYGKSDTTISNGITYTINSRGFGFKNTSYTYYATPWALPAYKANIKHFYITNTSNISFGNAAYLFYKLLNLESVDFNNASFSNVTDTSCMFYGCKALTTLNLSNFDTTNVTSMQSMFCDCKSLTTLDISNFDTSNVTNMYDMFNGCKALTTLNLSNFNTGSVTTIRSMFFGCSSLTSLDLSNFDTSKVTNMECMFDSCKALTSLDLSNFNTSNVTNMQYMFSGCKALTTLDLSSFDTSKVTTMELMFYNCSSLETLKTPSTNPIADITLPKTMYTHPDNTPYTTLPVTTGTSLELHNITRDGEWLGAYYGLLDEDGDGVKETVYVFGTITDTTKIYGPDYSSPKSNYQTYGFYKVLNDHPDVTKAIINCSLGERTNIGSLFAGCTQLVSLEFGANFDTSNITDMEYMFSRCSSLTSLDISNFNTSNVTTMYNMFSDCKSLTTLNLSNFNTSSVVRMDSMFSGCSSLTALDLSNFNTSNVTSMYYMFSNCSSLISLDVSNFDTSNVTAMYSMFSKCSSLTSLVVSNFNTSSVTNMDSMFAYCRSLTTLDLSNFNTSSVTKMSSTFYSCSSLTTLDISNFNTSNVTKMNSMFFNCSALTILNVNSFDTSKVKYMNSMFYDCKSLTTLDVSNFNTSSVTDMNGMFFKCNSLTSLDLSNFDTTKVTNMNDMFANCTSLTSLNVSKFNTSKVTKMGSMFQSCRSLTSLDLSNFDTSNVTKMDSMFGRCGSLITLDVSNFNTSNVTNTQQMFSGCTALDKIVLPINIGTCSISLPKTFYGYAADDTRPDKPQSYTVLPAADASIRLNYISGTKYVAIEALLKDATNEDYFLGVEHTSFKRENIASVNFITNSTLTPSDAVDVSLIKDEGVFAYSKASLNEGLYDIYVVTKYDKIYTNANVDGGAKYLFKGLYNCNSITGFEYLDLSRSSTAEGMFSGYVPETIKFPSTYYAHSENVDDTGNSTSSTYSNNLKEVTNVSIPGAAKLEITITLQTESTTYDFVAIYPGNVTPSFTSNSSNNLSEATISNGKIGGTTKSTKSFTYEGDSINILFRTDGSGNKYYGYYAVITAYDAENNVLGTTVDLPEKVLDLSNLNLPSGINTENFLIDCGNLTELKTFSTNTIDNIALPITMYTWPDKTSYTIMPTTSGTSVVLHDSDVVSFILNTAGDLYGTIDPVTKVLTITGTGTALDKKLSDVIGLDNSAAITGIVFNTNTVESICDVWCKRTTVTVTTGESYEIFGNLTGNLVLPSSLVTIGKYAFYKCGFTGDLVIPSSVTIIDDYAFSNCKGFTGNISLGSCLETIGTYAFSNCNGLSGTLTIPNSVTTIGSYAFTSCYELTGELVLPNSITTIEDFTFSSCNGFTKLVIPDSVTTIKEKAFNSCNNILEITIGSGLTSIGSNAFLTYIRSSSTGYSNANTVLKTTNVNAIQYDWLSNRRDVSLRYNLSTSGDLYGDLNITTGLLTVKGTGTDLNKALYNVLQSDVERALLRGISFETQTVEIIGYSWCDNYNYNLDPETHKAILYFPNLTGNLVLPSNLKEIKHGAFWQCTQLTGDLVIPEGVTSIGSYAFCSCDNMTGSLTLPSTLTTVESMAFSGSGFTGSLTLPDRLKNVGDNAFSGCHGFTGDIVIPRSMTSIPNGMFWWCKNLNGTLTIPNTVTSIGREAFYDCGFTGTLTIPSSVTTIGEINTDNKYSAGAFDSCTGFTRLVLNEGVTSIGDMTFSRCTGLSEVTIPNSVTTIGGYVFSDCTNLDTITIGNGITSTANIRNNIFRLPGGSNKDTFVKTENQVFLDYSWSGDNRNVKFCDVYNLNTTKDLFGCLETDTGILYVTGNGISLDKKLKDILLDVKDSVTGITFISDTVEDICNDWCYNFYYNTESKDNETLFANLTGNLILSNSITRIGNSAFSSCGFTGNLVIPNSVVSIGNSAFSSCKSFTGDLVIPDSVTTLGSDAFHGCNGFNGTLTLGSGLTKLNSGTFKGCSGFTGNLVIPDNITQIGDADVLYTNGAFDHCTGFNGTLTLSSNLTVIGYSSFNTCNGLTGDLVIPDSVTYLGEEAFSNCSGFNGTLTIGSGVSVLPDDCFYQCTGLTGSIVIPDGVTYIGYTVFASDTGFTGNLVIPDSVHKVDVQAFRGCTGLNGTLTLGSGLQEIGNFAFNECKNLTGNLVLPEGITFIGDGAFKDCYKFTGDLILPDSITTLGGTRTQEGCFQGCSGLNGTVKLPNGITSVPAFTFYNCNFTGQLEIPSSVTTIGSYAFSYNSFTGVLEIPEGVTSIGDDAFYYTDMTTVILPNSVTDVGNSCFHHCNKLTKLYIGNGITTLGDACFYVSNNIPTKLYTTSEVVKNYDWAGDNRTIIPMNTFTFALPQDISLKPKYLNVADAPVFYSAFNMEITGDFEDGSYGTFEGVPSFTISTESGETRTVTTNVADTTVSEDGTITVPIIFTAPNPTLIEEFSGQFQLPTVLHEVLPFAS